MFVAVCDQNFGNSTLRCSNAGPFRPGIRASRVSHSISSNGSRPGMVKKRRTPRRAPSSVTVFTTSVSVISVVVSCFTVAIEPLPKRSPPSRPSEGGGWTVDRASDGPGEALAALRDGRRGGHAAGLETSREPGRRGRQEEQDGEAAEDDQGKRDRLRVARADVGR